MLNKFFEYSTVRKSSRQEHIQISFYPAVELFKIDRGIGWFKSKTTKANQMYPIYDLYEEVEVGLFPWG